MSCNTKTSLAAVIDAVNAQLNNNYVDRDDPRIDQGVFTEPTIRGGLMLDEAAKLDFCGYVTECGLRAPFGKQWVDRPLYPDRVLVSYTDQAGDSGDEINTKWAELTDIIDDTMVTVTPKFPGAVTLKQSDVNAAIITAKTFGITGDGSDESAKLRKAISAIPKGGMLDLLGLEVSIGSSLHHDGARFGIKNGTIKALQSMVTDTEQPMLRLFGSTNFTLVNLVMDANRQERTPAEKSIHTIDLRSCKDFIMYGVKTLNGVCDGLYIHSNTPEDITTHTQRGLIINCLFDNAYRNNVSIITGRDITFNNSDFTNANGTLPQAGIDMESNDYGVDGIIENITFNDCNFIGNNGWQLMVTAHDSPKNIRVNGGVVTSNRGNVPMTSVGNTGGVLVANSDTVLDGVVFKDGKIDSGFAMRVHPVPGAYAQIRNCKFIGNEGEASNSDVYFHSISDGGELYNCDFINTGGISLYAPGSKVLHSRFKDMRHAGVYMASTAQDCVVSHCDMENVPGRGVYSEADGTIITWNRMKDVGTNSSIQTIGKGSVVESNTCVVSIPRDAPLLLMKAYDDVSVQHNMMFNGSATVDEYSLGLTAKTALTTKCIIRDNEGGVASTHKRRAPTTPTAVVTATTADRPAATAVVEGTQIFDVGLKTILVASGGVWNQLGKPPTASTDKVYSEITTLLAAPANSTVSQTFTLEGAAKGQLAVVATDNLLGGTHMWAEVTALNEVTVYRRNDTAEVAPALSGRVKIRVSTI